MATRSGRSYKSREMANEGVGLEVDGPMESGNVTGPAEQTGQETGPENWTPGQAHSEEGGTAQPMQLFMTQMMQLVSKMTEQQQRTAAEERAVERARQEEERRRLAEQNAMNIEMMMQQLTRSDGRREES